MNKLLPFLIFTFFGLLFFFPAHVFAQSATSCAIIDIGTITGPTPTIPVECVSSGELPAGMKPCLAVKAENSDGVDGEYCQNPPYVPNSTRSVFYSEPTLPNLYEKREQSSKWQDWGSKEMIAVLYEIAKKWKQGSPANAHRGAIPAHPQGHLIVMDIASDYHSEHHWGVAVDIAATTNQHDCVASNGSNWRCRYGPGNTPATIDLGKIIVDTGYFNAIWHSDTTANAGINAYAHAVDPGRYPNGATSGNTGARPVTEPHWDHIHLLIDRSTQKTSRYFTNFQRSKLQDCESLTGALRDVCF